MYLEVIMKKAFDKKSSSGLAKKAEKPQIPNSGTGTPPDAKPEHDQHSKHKGKKAAVLHRPKISA